MPKIFFQKRQPIEVSYGENLMKALLKAGLPIARSCEGEGVCAKCHVQVIEGQNNLSPRQPLEEKLLRENEIPSENRISCQCSVIGPVKVHTSYW